MRFLAAALTLSLGALVLLFFLRETSPDTALAGAGSPHLQPEPGPIDGDDFRPKRAPVVQRQLEVATASANAIDGSAQLEGRLEDDGLVGLRSALEATLYGRLDLDSIVGMAQDLVQMGVDSHAYPDPHPTGRVQFPILSTIDGVEATLAISRSRVFADVLTLSVSLEQPFEPYLLEGAVRNKPSVEITSWLDEDGELEHFGILTSLQPNRLTLDHGFSLTDGELTEGVSFHMDLSDPSGWKATPFGFEGGMPMDLHYHVAADQDPTTRLEQFRSLSRGLLGLRRGLDR